MSAADYWRSVGARIAPLANCLADLQAAVEERERIVVRYPPGQGDSPYIGPASAAPAWPHEPPEPPPYDPEPESDDDTSICRPGLRLGWEEP